MSEVKETKKGKNPKKESKKPMWFDGIKPESVESALKIGIIYPKFKAYKNTVYTIYLLSEPKYIDNEKGQFFTIDIEKDGMKFSLNMNESFKFQLFTLMKRKKAELQDFIKNAVPLHISKDDDGFWIIQLL